MRNRIKQILISIVSASFLIVSCQKIFFNDDENTRVISLKDFHAVKITGIYNLVLVQDSSNCLVISGKNDIKSIDAVINNDTLIINDHKKISLNTVKNTITLHFSNLDYMATYDPVNVINKGTIKADVFLFMALGEIAEVRLAIDCNYLWAGVSYNSLGYFHFTGKTNGCTLYNCYGFSIFADSLYCKRAEIVNESVGDIHINASQYILAHIRGSGNIYYHGTPVIEIAENRGGGRIIPAD